MINRVLFLLCCFCLLSISETDDTLWKIEEGEIKFLSDAPLEMIEARSNELLGLIDPDARTFAFAVNINSFEGFNGPLQRQHFNENYLESTRFPQATFKGRIIEKVNFDEPGQFTIRAKGDLNIHGVEQERIIKSEVTIENDRMYIKSYFSIRLDDHDITVPHIINQKIAENIEVLVTATFRKVARTG